MSRTTTVTTNTVELCTQSFGDPADPTILLITGAACSMRSWDDRLCRRLAAGGRHVVRYDQRDVGRSTTYPAGRPPYTLEHLADDAIVEERFLILPHPEVRDFMRRRADDTDRWLAGMRKLQARVLGT